MQSFGGEDIYSSIEAKAAHLLYFIVKNHPFVDGKRTQWCLCICVVFKTSKILDVTRITPPALTAITLLLAESASQDKEKMVGLVCGMLKKK